MYNEARIEMSSPKREQATLVEVEDLTAQRLRSVTGGFDASASLASELPPPDFVAVVIWTPGKHTVRSN